jgi:hypothetical protein
METGTVSQKQQLNQTVKLKKKLIITMMMVKHRLAISMSIPIFDLD